MEEQLLNIDAVCRWVGCCRGSIYAWVRNGTFPLPVKVGAKSVRWKSSHLEQWAAGLEADPHADDYDYVEPALLE